MNTEQLIRMANQIGVYFAVEPDSAVARAGVAEHLIRFWEKRMREDIYVYLDNEAGTELMPLVSEALTEYRSQILRKAR